MRVANAPCSWGVLEFEDGAAPAPFPRVLDEIRETGYAGTELGDWGFLPTEPERLRAELAGRGLALAGAFVPVALAERSAHAPGIDTAVRTARLMRDAGFPGAFIVLSDDNGRSAVRERHAGRIRPAHGLTGTGWRTFAAGAEAVARAVRDETGIATVFHAHCGGYVETAGEIGELMARTEPALLGLCFDTGHVMYGGADPVTLLERHADRVRHVHFKDCDTRVAAAARAEGIGYLDAVRRRLFSELGTGGVDFAAMTAALARHGYDGWIVVEQDVFPGQGTPRESARRNREVLRTLGL